MHTLRATFPLHSPVSECLYSTPGRRAVKHSGESADALDTIRVMRYYLTMKHEQCYVAVRIGKSSFYGGAHVGTESGVTECGLPYIIHPDLATEVDGPAGCLRCAEVMMCQVCRLTIRAHRHRLMAQAAP